MWLAINLTERENGCMSNNTDWDDEDDFDDLEEPVVAPQGDDAMKRLRKAKRADEKKIKELTERLESFTKAQRESVVKEVLNQKGVNQKAARLILKDLDDVSEDSVSNWLADNGDLFGVAPATPVDPQKQADLAALRQQDLVTQGGQSPDKQTDLGARVDNASYDELLAMIKSGQF